MNQNSSLKYPNNSDIINRPAHYTSGSIEPIDYIISHAMNFNRGNVIKYITRAGIKGDGLKYEIEDLEKAKWYIEREISRLKKINEIN